MSFNDLDASVGERVLLPNDINVVGYGINVICEEAGKSFWNDHPNYYVFHGTTTNNRSNYSNEAKAYGINSVVFRTTTPSSGYLYYYYKTQDGSDSNSFASDLLSHVNTPDIPIKAEVEYKIDEPTGCPIHSGSVSPVYVKDLAPGTTYKAGDKVTNTVSYSHYNNICYNPTEWVIPATGGTKTIKVQYMNHKTVSITYDKGDWNKDYYGSNMSSATFSTSWPSNISNQWYGHSLGITGSGQSSTGKLPSDISVKVDNNVVKTLTGWKCGNKIYSPGEVVTPTTNMTFTAQWKFKTYTITYAHSGISDIVNDSNYEPSSVQFYVHEIPETINTTGPISGDTRINAGGPGIFVKLEAAATQKPPLPYKGGKFSVKDGSGTMKTITWSSSPYEEAFWSSDSDYGKYYIFKSWTRDNKTYTDGSGDVIYSDQTYTANFDHVTHDFWYAANKQQDISYLDGNGRSRTLVIKIKDVPGSTDGSDGTVSGIYHTFKQYIGATKAMSTTPAVEPKSVNYTFMGWRYHYNNDIDNNLYSTYPNGTKNRIVVTDKKRVEAVWGGRDNNTGNLVEGSPNRCKISYDYNVEYFKKTLKVERDNYASAYTFAGKPADHYKYKDDFTYLGDSIPTCKLNGQTVAKFKGWNTKPDGTGTAYNYSYNGKGSVTNTKYDTDAPLTLYAIWELEKFDIIFYDNPNKDEANNANNVNSWGIVTKRVSSDPRKVENKESGSRDGWYVKFTKEFDRAFEIPNIIPDQDGSDEASTYDKYDKYGSGFNAYDKNGYDFNRWLDTTNGSNVDYYAKDQGENPYIIAYDVNSNRKLYAQWDIHKNRLAYVDNTTTGDELSVSGYSKNTKFDYQFDRWVYTQLKGDTVNRNFTRTGWISIGWSRLNNSTEKDTLKPGRKFLMPNVDVTLYSITKRDHVLTLASDMWNDSQGLKAPTIYNTADTFTFNHGSNFNTDRSDRKYTVYFDRGNDANVKASFNDIKGAYNCSYTVDNVRARSPLSSTLIETSLSEPARKDVNVYFDGWYTDKDTDDINYPGENYIAYGTSDITVRVTPNNASRYTVQGNRGNAVVVATTSGDWRSAATGDYDTNREGGNYGKGTLYAHYTTPVIYLPEVERRHPSKAVIEYNQNYKQEGMTTAERDNSHVEKDLFMGWFSAPQTPNGQVDTRTDIVFYGKGGDPVYLDSELLALMDANGGKMTFYPWFNICPKTLRIHTGVKFYEDQIVGTAHLKSLFDIDDMDLQNSDTMKEDYTFYGYEALSDAYGMEISSFLNIAYPNMPQADKEKVISMAGKHKITPVVTKIEYDCDGLDSDMKHYSRRTSGFSETNPGKLNTERDNVGHIKITYEYVDSGHVINKILDNLKLTGRNNATKLGDTQIKWTETVDAEIMFNDPPTIEVNNVYVYSTGKEVNVDNIRNYLLKRQNAKDEQDDFDNLPWWSAENRDGWKEDINGTRKKLDEHIYIEKVGDIIFDYGFENTDAEHKALCSRLKLGCHQPEDIFRLKDSSNEIEKQAFLHIKSFRAYFITKDQFGKTNATPDYEGNDYPFSDLADRRYGQLEEERSIDVIMFNNQDDDSLGDAMVNEDVRYVTADTLLEDDSYWADDKSDGGAAKLRETFQNKRDADNGKKPSSVTHGKVGDTNVTIEDY